MEENEFQHFSEILSGIPIEDHEEPFARAIVESPNDHTPKLVFADWLDEQGDLRGELIRVRVEFARTLGEPNVHDNRLLGLAEREVALARALNIEPLPICMQWAAINTLASAMRNIGVSAANAADNILASAMRNIGVSAANAAEAIRDALPTLGVFWSDEE